MPRFLGVDIGTVRVGIAVSDPEGIFAQPLTVLEREICELEIHRIATELEVTEIVVGIPYKMDGSRGPAVDAAEHFADALAVSTQLPVSRWDERLSTVQAEMAMRAMGKDSKKQRGVVDKVAAAVVLQAFLDHRRLA